MELVMRQGLLWLICYSLLLATGTVAPAIAGDFVVPKKEFMSRYRAIVVYPIFDSLKMSCVDLAQQGQKNIVIHPQDTVGSNLFQTLYEWACTTRTSKYLLACKTLRLQDHKARDSVLASIDAMIAAAFMDRASPLSLRFVGRQTVDTIPPDSVTAYLRTCLRLEPRTVFRNRGNYRNIKINVCYTIVSTWAYDWHGTPLWHKESDIDYMFEEVRLEDFMKQSLVQDAINQTFKPFFK
jgi:hypothetical protein